MVNINLKTLITCSSTNDLAFQAAQDGLEEGTSFLSYSQTKGRGRNDNKWTSIKGNLFLSTIIRPRDEKKNWQQLSLIVALSVIEVLLKLGINQNLIELKLKEKSLFGMEQDPKRKCFMLKILIN